MSKRDKQGKFVQRSLSQQAWIQFRSNRLAICGLVVIALLILVSITTILIDLTDGGELYKVLVTKNNLPMKLAKPSAAHPLGCDEFGRDLLFRLLWGTRYSLFAGICTILAAILTGGVFGSIAGFYGGKIDNVIMRFMDMVMTGLQPGQPSECADLLAGSPVCSNHPFFRYDGKGQRICRSRQGRGCFRCFGHCKVYYSQCSFPRNRSGHSRCGYHNSECGRHVFLGSGNPAACAGMGLYPVVGAHVYA